MRTRSQSKEYLEMLCKGSHQRLSASSITIDQGRTTVFGQHASGDTVDISTAITSAIGRTSYLLVNRAAIRRTMKYSEGSNLGLHHPRIGSLGRQV